MIQIHWLLQSLTSLPQDDEWLAWSERAYLGGLRFARRRHEWRLGRWTAKTAVIRCLGDRAGSRQPREIEIRSATDGAPEVSLGGRAAPVVLSLSHRAGLCLAALAPAGASIGCDMELIEPRSEGFVEDSFTDAEKEVIRAAPTPAQPLVANLLWSAKESVFKALRTGLRLDSLRLEVTLPGEPDQDGWRPLAVRHTPTGRSFHGWWCREGHHLLTVASDPAPEVPVELRPPLPHLPGGA